MRISSTLAGIYNDICLTYVYKHMQVGGVHHKLLEISDNNDWIVTSASTTRWVGQTKDPKLTVSLFCSVQTLILSETQTQSRRIRRTLELNILAISRLGKVVQYLVIFPKSVISSCEHEP
jgi:hypothetical protein